MKNFLIDNHGSSAPFECIKYFLLVDLALILFLGKLFSLEILELIDGVVALLDGASDALVVERGDHHNLDFFLV